MVIELAETVADRPPPAGERLRRGDCRTTAAPTTPKPTTTVTPKPTTTAKPKPTTTATTLPTTTVLDTAADHDGAGDERASGPGETTIAGTCRTGGAPSIGYDYTDPQATPLCAPHPAQGDRRHRDRPVKTGAVDVVHRDGPRSLRHGRDHRPRPRSTFAELAGPALGIIHVRITWWHLSVTLTRRQAHELLARARTSSPSRALGQNFVVDPNTVRRIARLAEVGPGDHVVEIGAGPRVAHARAGGDRRGRHRRRGRPPPLPVLREVVEPVGVARSCEADALKLDWRTLLRRRPLAAWSPTFRTTSPRRSCATCSTACPQIDRMLVMVQREVGERLAARAATKAYGVRLGEGGRTGPTRRGRRTGAGDRVPAQAEGRVRARARSCAGSSPAVADVDPEWLFALVRAGFGHRRKMLRGALAGVATVEQLDAAGVAPTARAEELDVDAWGRLAREASPRG